MGRFRLGAKLKSKSLCLNYDLLAHEKFPNWDCFQKCFTTVSWNFLNCFICSFSTPLPWCTETHLSFSALSSTHLHLGGKLDLLSSKPVCDCGNKAPLPQFKTYITQDQLLEMTHRSRSCSSRRRKVFELPLLQRCTELWLGGDCLNVPNYRFPN